MPCLWFLAISSNEQLELITGGRVKPPHFVADVMTLLCDVFQVYLASPPPLND